MMTRNHALGRKLTWIAIILIIAIAAIGCSVRSMYQRDFEKWGERISKKHKQIHESMSEAEVIELLGPPGDYSTELEQTAELVTLISLEDGLTSRYRQWLTPARVVKTKHWVWNDGLIAVDFDMEGKVDRASMMATPPPETFLERIRRYLRDHLGI